MSKRYHYLVLPVKPTHDASQIRQVLNSLSEGYRLKEIKPGRLTLLGREENYIFEREIELPVTIYPEGAKNYAERNLVYHLVKAGRWEDIEKLLHIDFFKEEAKKAIKYRDEKKSD